METSETFGRPTDRYGLGAVGMPYTANSDYRPIPPDAYGTLFIPERIRKGYYVEELNDGVYYVSSGAYDGMFVATGNGVVVVDTPPLLGTNYLRAIREVTDEPVTHVIYSHWHADHIGGAGIYGPDVTYVSHEYTRELLERWPDLGGRHPLHLPTLTFSDNETLDVNGVRLQLDYRGVNHSPGNIFIYAPKQKVLGAIDIITPGWSTFEYCDASENIRGWAEAHDWILEYDFRAVVSGHLTRWGTRDDATTSREYVQDLLAFSQEAVEEVKVDELVEKIGFANNWVLWENLLNELTNYVVKKTLEKKSGNGQTWAERLAGADVATKYHAASIVQAQRLEWGRMTKLEGMVAPPDEP